MVFTIGKSLGECPMLFPPARLNPRGRNAASVRNGRRKKQKKTARKPRVKIYHTDWNSRRERIFWPSFGPKIRGRETSYFNCRVPGWMITVASACNICTRTGRATMLHDHIVIVLRYHYYYCCYNYRCREDVRLVAELILFRTVSYYYIAIRPISERPRITRWKIKNKTVFRARSDRKRPSNLIYTFIIIRTNIPVCRFNGRLKLGRAVSSARDTRKNRFTRINIY
jgi:hypothetical protein